MQTIKKKKYIIFTSIILVTCLIGILIGSFLDLKISKTFVNSHSFYGAFIETIGASLSYATIPLGTTLIFLALYKKDKWYYKLIAWFSLLLGLGLSTYFLGNSLVKGSFYQEIVFTPFSGYFAAFILMFIISVLAYIFTDTTDRSKLIKIGLIMSLSMLIQFGLMNLLKKVGGRPRYRYLIDSNLNAAGDTFLNWWQFQPFSKHGDNFKSWPSGHTTTAAQLILLTLYSQVFKYKNKFVNTDSIFFTIGYAYTLVIAISRVLYGAHFVSDVSWGFFISLLVMSLVYFTIDNIYKAIMKKIEPNKVIE